ncbi:MAG: phage major capsid protein [Clostridiales bacterium]|nr:phage major capsid protein [Clostridiales bacterium]
MTREEIMNLDAEGIEKRNAEIKAEIEAATEQAQLDALVEERKALDERQEAIVMEARKADMLKVAEGAGKVVASAPVVEQRSNDDVLKSEEYVNAYARYLVDGNADECRSLLTTNVSGQLPVPTIIDEIIRTAWDRSEILSRVRRTFVKGNLKVAFEKSATGANVHTEGTSAPTEEVLELGIVEMIPANIKKWITISDEAVAMGGERLLRYIYDEITYQIVTKKLTDLVVGDIVAAPTSASSTKASAAAITAAPGLDTVAKAFANLSDEAREPVVIMNKLTYANFKTAQVGGNYAVDPFEGLPVLFNNSLPAYDAASANAVYMIVGDLSGVQVNYPEGDGVVIKYDDLSLAESDLVKVVGRQYAAHAVTACGRFCNVKKGA